MERLRLPPDYIILIPERLCVNVGTEEGLLAIGINVPAKGGVAVGVRTADCIPVLLYDCVHRAVAAVHAGWKGTVKRISQVTIAKMKECYGTRAEDLRAVIGPGIGPESFQVGAEIVEVFKEQGFVFN